MNEPAGPSRLLRDNVVVALGTGLSRVSGFLRIAVLSTTLGAGGIADAYNLANNTPNMVFELLLGGILTATLIPVFTTQFDDGDDDATSAVVSTAVIALVVLSVLTVVGAPLLIRAYTLIAHEDSGNFTDVATRLARYFLPQIFFYGVTALATSLLNARRRFAAAAFAPALNNLLVIVVLLVVSRRFDDEIASGTVSAGLVHWLGIGTTIGIVMMSIALVPALTGAGLHLRWRPDFGHRAVRHVLRLSGWTVGYVVSNQVALFVVLALALRDGSGGLSAYLYAYTFFQLPHGLLAVSIMTTFAPDLARAASAERWHRFRGQMRLGIQALGLLMLPASAGYIVLSRPLVGLLRHGNFDATKVQLTADTLASLTVGLFAFSLYLFVLRGFYALSDTRTPFRINVFENALNIVLALLLFPRYGVQGVAFSYSLAYIVAAAVAWRMLADRVGPIAGPRTTRSLIQYMTAAIVTAAATHLVVDGIDEPVLALAAGVPVGVAVYVGAVFGLRAIELRRGGERRRPLR
ncbi:MAG: murein biosynthesis integral membrane protein MurJ [Acidimicrobiia bacterium]